MRSIAATLPEVVRAFIDGEAGPIAVGYSGGRDSAVLLWALVQAAGAGRVTALHVDHGWRPREEREAEATVVRGWCARLGVNLVSFPPPETPRLTEADAREHRYSCYREFLGTQPQATIYLGHHADDQAETVLMRLLKGRSWQGLSGMSARRGPFRRPFLTISKDVLAEAARENSIPWHEDSTNGDTKPVRNYLRTLMPELVRRFPRAVAALGDFASVWNEVHGYRVASAEWRAVPGGFRIDARWDQWSPVERQAELLALAADIESGKAISRRFLETVCSDGRQGSARGSGWIWRRSANSIFWGKVAPSAAKEYFIRVAEGRQYDLGDYRFLWKKGEGGLELPLDPSKPWIWRSAWPGMRFVSAQGTWSRAERKRRLGSLAPNRMAVAVQDGLIRAVVDPSVGTILWIERGEKLHKPGIFVTLVTVMPNSTEKL